MFSAMSIIPPNPDANRMRAPGAMPCTICAIPRPSSLPPGWSARTSTGVSYPHGLPGPGSTPAETSSAGVVVAVAEVAYESDRMPIVTPLPSTSKASRARAVFSGSSASTGTLRQLSAAAVAGRAAADDDDVPTAARRSSATATTPGSAARADS